MNAYNPGMNPYMPGMPWPAGHPGMGYPPHPQGHYAFCPSCGYPPPLCICDVPGCRKEARELLVRPGDGMTQEYQQALRGRVAVAGWGWLEVIRKWAELAQGEPIGDEGAEAVIGTPSPSSFTSPNVEGMARASLKEIAPIFQRQLRGIVGIGDTYVGGGCCVHLSIEYTATLSASAVAVAVIDPKNTVMTWAKANLKTGYTIKEGIIHTSPGSLLVVAVGAAVARVRWCEVFGC